MHNVPESIEEHLLRAMTGFERTPGDVPAAMAAFRINGDFPGFAGHFPGTPLFSAIFQLTLVRLTAERLLDKPLAPYRTGRVKFKGMVVPGEEVVLTVMVREEEDGWAAQFSITRRGEKVTSGSLIYRETR